MKHIHVSLITLPLLNVECAGYLIYMKMVSQLCSACEVDVWVTEKGNDAVGMEGFSFRLWLASVA